MSVKKLTAAAAYKRLKSYEVEIMNPILAQIRARTEPEVYPLDDLLIDAVHLVHEELRRVASEMEGQ